MVNRRALLLPLIRGTLWFLQLVRHPPAPEYQLLYSQRPTLMLWLLDAWVVSCPLCLYVYECVCSFKEMDDVVGVSSPRPPLRFFRFIPLFFSFLFSSFVFTMPIVALIADRERSPSLPFRQEGHGRVSELNNGRTKRPTVPESLV